MNATFLIGAAEGVQWGDFLFYLLTFTVLIAAVKHFAWGPVTEMMEKRANKIANDIDSAEDARKKAEELAAQREEALKDSHVEASKIIDRDSAQSEVMTMKDNAKKDIEQQRQEAMSGIKNDVAELSIEIASKIIQKELNAEDQKALVDSYIEGLGKQNGIR